MKFCTQNMGLMTECGDNATKQRDGFPLCDQHASTYDALVKAEKEMEAMEQER